jgi:hypothetical protein
MTAVPRRLVFGLLPALGLIPRDVLIDIWTAEDDFTTDNLLVKATVRMSKAYIGRDVVYPGSAPIWIDFDHGEGWDKLA